VAVIVARPSRSRRRGKLKLKHSSSGSPEGLAAGVEAEAAFRAAWERQRPLSEEPA
jgi:hypothetical protein